MEGLKEGSKLVIAKIYKSVAAGTRYPIDFDLVWGLMYATKGSAKRALKRAAGIDRQIRNIKESNGPVKKGRPRERIVMTLTGFKDLCLQAPGYGKLVWAYYEEIAQAASTPAPIALVPEVVVPPATPLVLGDETKLKLRRFHEEICVAEAAGTQYPVDFDAVWGLMYGRKDNAKRALKGPGIDGEILCLRPEDKSDDKVMGRPSDTILMTVKAFKHFCLKAPGTLGAQIRDYYISLEEVAHAAIAVAHDVASGDVTVTANTPGGVKRLRELEGAISVETKKSRALYTQAAAHEERANVHDSGLKHGAENYNKVIAKSIENRNAKIVEMEKEWKAKVEAINKEQTEELALPFAVAQAQARHHALAKEEALCSARVARTEAELEEQRTAAKIREYEELKQQLTAETAANYNEMLARQRAEAVAWLQQRKDMGEPLTDEMEATLAGAV